MAATIPTGADWFYQLVTSALLADPGADTAPTTDPKAMAELINMQDIVTKRRNALDKTAAYDKAAMYKAQLEYIKSGRDIVAKLRESAGKDRRVSAQVKKDLQVQLMRSRTDLATKSAQYQSRIFGSAKAAFDNARGAGQPGVAAASDAILKTLTAEGVGYNPQDPSVGGLAEQYAQMVFGKSLMDLSEQEVRAKLEAENANNELQVRTQQFVRDGKQSVAAARGAEAVLNEQQRLINSIGVSPDGTIRGENFDQLLSATQKAQAAFESLTGDPEELSKRLEAVAGDDSEYRRLLQLESKLQERILGEGSEGLRTRMGRFLANPEVQEWAAAYGYKAGQAKIGPDGKVVYVPGPDDDKILMRYSYQATHPDRFGRLFKNQGATRDLVRITATDPKQREELLKANDLGGGQFAIQAGEVLSPEAYAKTLIDGGMRPGGFQYAKADGKMYVKSSSGAYYEYDKAAKTFGPELKAADVPTGLSFKDAVIFGSDGKPVRYMTGDDLAKGIEGMKLGYADEAEAKQIQEKTPANVQIVSADQVPAGAVTAIGYLDKPRAGLPAGAVSINNGQQVFTKDVKVEVLAKDAEKKPVSRIAAKAEREAQTLKEAGKLPSGKGVSEIRPAAPEVPAAAPVQPHDLARNAAMDPVSGESQLATLMAAGLISSEQAQEARDAVAAARAEVAVGKKPATAAPAPFVGEDGWKYQFVGDKVYVVGKEGGSTTASPENPIELKPEVAAKAKAELDAAKKAAKQEPVFVQTKDGAIYEIAPTYARELRPGAEQLPAKGTMASNTDEYVALVDRLTKEAPTMVTREAAEAAKPVRATFPAPEKKAPKIETKAGGTVVVEGPETVTRPTRREALKATLSKVGDIFKKKAAPERDVPPPSAKAAAALEDASERLKKTPPPAGPAPKIDLDEDTAPTPPGASTDKRQTSLSTFRTFQKKAKEPSGGPNVLGTTTTTSGVA